VLRPAGVTGALDPTWRVMGSFGGWRMNGADYLAFLETLDPVRAIYGPVVQRWMLDSYTLSYQQIDAG
jgi:hypothetical protein